MPTMPTGNTETTAGWKFEGLSYENIKPPLIVLLLNWNGFIIQK